MRKIHSVLVGLAFLGFGGCNREDHGSLRRVDETRERVEKPAQPLPEEGASDVVASRGVQLRNDESEDISSQGFASTKGTISVRDTRGPAHGPRARGTYSVIETGGQPGGGAPGGGGGANAGGVNAGGVNNGGAGGMNTGAVNGGIAGGFNTGGTGGLNNGVTTGGQTSGVNTGGTGGGGVTAGNTSGIRDTTAAESRSRPNNPDALGTGTKYPDDSVQVRQ